MNPLILYCVIAALVVMTVFLALQVRVYQLANRAEQSPAPKPQPSEAHLRQALELALKDQTEFEHGHIDRHGRALGPQPEDECEWAYRYDHEGD